MGRKGWVVGKEWVKWVGKERISVWVVGEGWMGVDV